MFLSFLFGFQKTITLCITYKPARFGRNGEMAKWRWAEIDDGRLTNDGFWAGLPPRLRSNRWDLQDEQIDVRVGILLTNWGGFCRMGAVVYLERGRS